MKRSQAGFGVALLGVLLAALFAIASFWLPGLTQHRASMLAAFVFPAVLLGYVLAT
jgi:hypothetical protein